MQYDRFPRYCLKMATGTGKTKVIALPSAWQYFNAIREDSRAYAATSLLIAPNVIVFERLKSDFAGGRIFKTDPDIPPSLEILWDFDCYMRGEAERASSQGALYVTNIHQLYEGQDSNNGDEANVITTVLGPRPPTQTNNIESFDERIYKRSRPVFVVNDEAHHTHDEDNEWNKTIRRLHDSLAGRNLVS